MPLTSTPFVTTPPPRVPFTCPSPASPFTPLELTCTNSPLNSQLLCHNLQLYNTRVGLPFTRFVKSDPLIPSITHTCRLVFPCKATSVQITAMMRSIPLVNPPPPAGRQEGKPVVCLGTFAIFAAPWQTQHLASDLTFFTAGSQLQPFCGECVRPWNNRVMGSKIMWPIDAET